MTAGAIGIVIGLTALVVGLVTLNSTSRPAPRPPVRPSPPPVDDEVVRAEIARSWADAGYGPHPRRDWGAGVRAAHRAHLARFAADHGSAEVHEEDHAVQ